MRFLYTAIVYLSFLLSGAAALMYEVLWVRYLGLVFGGSHLAVTTVLSVFMGGLALGSWLIGGRIGRFNRLFRLYGLFEIGIALSALLFALLMKVYPSIYTALARIAPESPLYLSAIRVAFAGIAMIVPTTLMGGTLPVLSALVSRRAKTLGHHLSFLYGFNTLGAVIGTGAAGFIFLGRFTVSGTLWIAVVVNLAIGLLAIALDRKAEEALGDGGTESSGDETPVPVEEGAAEYPFPLKAVLWGIGVSGFCALGYEVLWTRILAIVVGASVYGFTTMLVAFLLGIAAGSYSYGVFGKLASAIRKGHATSPMVSVAGFGLVQVAIGACALLVTLYLRDLPTHALYLQGAFSRRGLGLFASRQWASFALAFSCMAIPAFFMGFAFPLAGKVNALYRNSSGRAAGEVLAFNTVGAILGAAASGFHLVYLFGIERSLQILTLVNVGFGLFIIASTRRSRALHWAAPALTAAAILFLALNPGAWRMWETKYFAIYRTNDPEPFRTPEKVREAIENTEVLYYAEGVEAIVSSIRVKGGYQAFLTNGRVEASTHNEGLQCQYTLGHLPMLLARNPRKVFVLGTGSGMTLGATSAYPDVEEITLAEIEPKVLGVARTFAEYNHHVLDNPKVRIVLNDGRNFLLTTKEKFDVITADPIHPWFSGAGYLYTTEYFRLAAERLRPGGVVCQWLPIYELTNEDLQSVVKTFSGNFRHVLIWLTHDDAELIGSNDPIVIDPVELEKRMAAPEVARDLKRVYMGSADDFLSYFVMGTAGARAFGEGGVVNTDDNLYLEFSAPLSVGKASLMEKNVSFIARYRESILPYLRKPEDALARAAFERRWRENGEAAGPVLQAQAVFLGGRGLSPEFRSLMDEIESRYPGYAPWRFLKNEHEETLAQQPRLLQKTDLPVLGASGMPATLTVAAVSIRIGAGRAVVMFVDPRAKVQFGELYVSGEKTKEIEEFIIVFATEVLGEISSAYLGESHATARGGRTLPSEIQMERKVREIVSSRAEKKEIFLK